jgi:4-hydroxy-3-methylbut-2-enyl diphosphate reductase
VKKRLLLAFPRGFCFGVERAVKMLNETLASEKDKTVYMRKEIVHNAALIAHYKARGAVVVNEVDEVPEGGVVVFSAHGVAPSVRENAKARNLKIIDTTCPLVTKIHKEALSLAEQGYTIILIGETGHKEMIGVMGEAPENIRFINSEKDFDSLAGIDGSRAAWLSQTTLNVDDAYRIVGRLREMFPLIQDPPESDICYATKERQSAVKDIAGECDLFIVIGSENSSNAKRLAEVASTAGAAAVSQIDEPEDLRNVDFSSVYTIGATCGVSVSPEQWNRAISYLEALGYASEEKRAAEE